MASEPDDEVTLSGKKAVAWMDNDH